MAAQPHPLCSSVDGCSEVVVDMFFQKTAGCNHLRLSNFVWGHSEVWLRTVETDSVTTTIRRTADQRSELRKLAHRSVVYNTENCLRSSHM